MNAQLANAFRALQEAGAAGLPSEEEVMAAAEGATWSGKLGNGKEDQVWELVKHGEESYTTHTGF